MRTTTEESAKTIATLQCSVEAGIEDYDLLLEGNKSFMSEHDEFFYCREDLKADLMKVRSDAEKNVADLEATVKSTEAHNIDVDAAGEKRLQDFEDELVKDLSELHALYVHNTQSIGGVHSAT
jgi:hypothetical protein